MKDHDSASDVVKKYFYIKHSFDQSNLGGKNIKVEFQDDSKRRKDSKYFMRYSVWDAIIVEKKVISPDNAKHREAVQHN